jgi:hypothetical protein
VTTLYIVIFKMIVKLPALTEVHNSQTGAFGGSSTEDGKSDPLALLLVFRELLLRHQKFLSAMLSSESIFSERTGRGELGVRKVDQSSMEKVRHCITALGACIDVACKDLDIDHADDFAKDCLATKSKKCI